MKVNITYSREVLDNGDYVTSADVISDTEIAKEDMSFTLDGQELKISNIEEIEKGYHVEFELTEKLSTLQFDADKFINNVVLPQIIFSVKESKPDINVNYQEDPFIKDFKKKIFQTDKIQLSYLIYENGNKDKKRPLVLFLHGSGERGFNNTLPLLGNDVPKTYHNYIKTNHQNAVVLVPQATWAPTLNGWFRKDFRKALFELIAKVEKEYNLDKDRIYLSGLSNGASTSWYMGAHHADTFAAIIPCSGFVYGDNKQELGNMKTGRYMEVTQEEAKALASVPIWAFHSEDDPTVSVQGTRKARAAIEEVDDSNLKVTIYPKGTVLPNPHASWSKAYNTLELLPWLFSQSKAKQTIK